MSHLPGGVRRGRWYIREMPIPACSRLRYTAPLPSIGNVNDEVRRIWSASKTLSRIQAGQRIAVAVGSRGIANHAALVRGTIEAIQSRRGDPFIVAAMGSHGGGTSDGQHRLLADYGITESAMGVPIRCDMDVDLIGVNALGRPVYWDRNALAADGVVTVGRVKPHTDFRGHYESGIVKMMVVGLGKRIGADAMHAIGVKGLKDSMPASAEVVLAKTNYLGGLAVLENAREETAIAEIVDRDRVMTREPELLERARTLMGRLPWTALDVLIVGEIGKNYSGCGIDPNVVGRYLVESRPDLETNNPSITRIAALDLSPESHGNGIGVGIADLTTHRLLNDFDDNVTRTNVFTARFLWRAKKPFALPTDRDCIEAAIQTCWQPESDDLSLAIIPNSLELSEIWANEAAIRSIVHRHEWTVDPEPQPLPFSNDGRLDQARLFPHSHQARRLIV